MKAVLAALLLLATVDEARRAADARPKHPRLQFELAAALASSGAHDDALARLERIALWGFIYRPDQRKEFEALKTLPRFQSVMARFVENAAPIGKPELAFTLEQKALIAEGLAFDAKTKRFFVSSVREKKIFAIDRHGQATAFVSGLEDGAFGMAIDAKRGVLWVASSSLPQVEGFREERAALLKIDLATGRVLSTLRLNGKHVFGDVTVAPDGEVFVSDSVAPDIYHLENDALKLFIRGSFRSPQGLAATSRYLYLADYGNGLFAIDRRTRDAVPLTMPPDISLLGVDGIYLVNDRTLVATQNGTNPMRVLRLTLSPDGLGIESMQTLAANHPPMTDVTLGTLASGAFHFIANAQWEAWTEKGERNPKVTGEPVRILRVPI
jgi:hypothetical protein